MGIVVKSWDLNRVWTIYATRFDNPIEMDKILQTTKIPKCQKRNKNLEYANDH